jgi:O-succinylbenzoic acid--CoA ligase
MERVELARLLAVGPAGLVPQGDLPPGPVVIAERDPARFMDAFALSVASPENVFLCDPAWTPADRAALDGLLGASSAGPLAQNLNSSVPYCGTRGWLMIPSGGSSGRLKFARHDQDTLAAAVRGFRAHFGVGQVNCVGLLPLHHVSGLMAWMRAALTGGSYLPWDWKELEKGSFPVVRGPGWFVSLVPTQLQRLLSRPEAVGWLRGFQAVFVGGGPVWPELAEAAARARLPVSPGYGMTETAAMVAALGPEDFLEGRRGSGRPMPHARIDITDDGLVRVSGESLFRGYFPEWRGERTFTTEDLGNFDDRGILHIAGRRDDLIITGGRKVDPREVEAALRDSGQFSDVAVIGVPDPEWGHAVVACYPGDQPVPNLDQVAFHLAGLAGYKRPRRFAAIQDWPRNAQGKINRAALLGAFARTGPAA